MKLRDRMRQSQTVSAADTDNESERQTEIERDRVSGRQTLEKLILHFGLIFSSSFSLSSKVAVVNCRFRHSWQRTKM